MGVLAHARTFDSLPEALEHAAASAC
jgi:hypothetical protein